MSQEYVMPVFKDFSENGELLQVREEPLNEVNLPRYIKVNSLQKAEGYIEAVENIIEAIEPCFIKDKSEYEKHGTVITPNSPVIAAQKIKEIFQDNTLFLGVVDRFAENPYNRINSNEPYNSWYDDYASKNGREKAEGHLDGARDMLSQMEKCFEKDRCEHEKHGTVITPNSPHIISRMIKELCEERKLFVSKAKFIIK